MGKDVSTGQWVKTELSVQFSKLAAIHTLGVAAAPADVVWTIPNHNATSMLTQGTLSSGASVFLANTMNFSAVSPCQDEGYRLFVSAEGMLDSQGLSPADVWAVCYNETAND